MTRQGPADAVRPGDARKRVLLLGGCQVAGLGDELRDDFDCIQLWRRPTIALMSAPARPDEAPPAALGFEDRQSRYILRDCAKAHLAELRAASCDVLVFEIVRDVRCPLVRGGEAYLFDPNRMHNLVPDAPPAAQRVIDTAALLGGTATESLESLDPRFFAIWCAHFDRFHEAVLAPRIAQGCVVIVQQVFLAKQTLPPSDLLRDHWDYCDAVNALLRRMYAHIASRPGIRRVGVAETLCVTASGAPRGGIAITHLLPEVFALMADQVRAVLAPGHPDDGEATVAESRLAGSIVAEATSIVAKSTFAHLMARAGAVHAQVAALERDRHERNLEILHLREQLAYRDALHAWEMRRVENRRPLRRAGRLLRRLGGAVRGALSPASP